ncbi:MAG: OmpH family outer membrane protein [Spirochaetales bacterium]
MKKLTCIFLCIIAFTYNAFSQQLTLFGVVDTALVYTTYFRDTTGVRNYEAKKAEFQKEIDTLTAELRALQIEKVDYERAGNSTMATRLEGQITQKAAFIKEYTWAKNIELENLRKNLADSDTFYENLHTVIGQIAEEGGYSMILDLQNDAVLWYSPTVDITRDVITRLSRL